MIERSVLLLVLAEASAAAQPAKNDYSDLVDIVGAQANAFTASTRKSQ